jgi:hypothetical protein
VPEAATVALGELSEPVPPENTVRLVSKQLAIWQLRRLDYRLRAAIQVSEAVKRA